MKLTRVFFFLVILGSSAVAADAQTSIAPTDPRIVFNTPDPACPAGMYCVNLTYTGPQENALIFGVPGPPGSFLEAAPLYTYSCVSNAFAGCQPDENQAGTEFFAYSLFDGSVTSGETFSLTSTGPIQLTLPTGFTCNPGSACSMVNGVLVADLTPEPGTAILFMSGLIFVVGLTSKRLVANPRI
jgi:hypothetical protein